MSEKIRLDARIFELGLSESREKAKAFIMAGQVYVNGMKATKAGMTVTAQDQIDVRGGSEFVSRGGHKLKKAMSVFPINLENKICMDIGASTGGFTDCMLQNGASKVYSIDVGYGQLAWKLRQDERVVNMERTNFRYVTHEEVPDEIDFASVDVSFISAAGEILVCKDGAGVEFSEELAKKILLEKEIGISVSLNDGTANAVAWGCDLTYDYVKINGDYRT